MVFFVPFPGSGPWSTVVVDDELPLSLFYLLLVDSCVISYERVGHGGRVLGGNFEVSFFLMLSFFL